MKKVKRVAYNVTCAHNPAHKFQKVFEIEEGSENQETQVQAYCAGCDKNVTVTVQGKVVPDAELLRKFKLDG